MTIRTSKADRNLFSISNGICGLYEGTDNPQSVLLDYLQQPNALLPERPGDWDATMKVCDQTKDLTLAGLRVAQGMENALDLNNRVNNVRLAGDWGVTGGEGDQVITVKGGCHDVTVAGVIHSHGRNADVVVGAWSDQCFDASTNLDFSNLTRADGQSVTFILARCVGVKLPPKARVLWVKTAGYAVYWYGKWAYVKALRALGKG